MQSTFNRQQVEGRFKRMLSSYRKYKAVIKRTGSERKEYEFASEIEKIFGNCHSTSPTFLVESSSTSTSKPTTQKSRANKLSSSRSSDSSDNNEESRSSKDNKKQINEGKSEKKERKHHRTTGASQLIDFLKCFTEKREEEEDKKKEEEDRKREETMHKEQMFLANLQQRSSNA